MIEIRNVSLRLDGKSILNNISLTLEPGKIYGLVGGTVTVSNDITAMPAVTITVNEYGNIK